MIKSYVKTCQTNARFKFGDGKVHKSKCIHMVPAYFGGQRKFIMFDEVNCKLPLLLSLQLLKKMDLRIRFKHDTAKLPTGPTFRLKESKGHYWVNIGKKFRTAGSTLSLQLC